MTDEPTIPVEKPANNLPENQDLNKINEELVKIIKKQAFLSDNIQFNATIYQGFDIILKHLVNIEEILKNLNKNGN